MFVGAAVLTIACCYAAGLLLAPRLVLPRAIRLALGAVLVSGTVFLLLLAGWLWLPVLWALAAVLLAAGAWRFRTVRHPEPSRIALVWWIPFAIYGAMYLLQAMAPEIQPDAVTYHLSLAAEYARLHGFPNRIGFYEVIPQGMEMLFTAAYALGGAQAVKLVHFAFLLATVPLIMAAGGRLRIAPERSFIAGLLYFAMPVAGITGTCTYNDAALVFFTVAVFYCLVVWHRDQDARLLPLIGLLAGFCFAIKITGAPVTAAAIAVVLLTARRPMPVIPVIAAALLAAAPWTIRALVLTGNPFAPLLNSWFPNPYFSAQMEHTLAENLRAYPGFTLLSAPLEYALRGRLEGIIGPMFFALPLALWALRTAAGRVLILAGGVAIAPWFLNAGTRFLMPAIPFLALALASAMPTLALRAILGLQLLLCWPPILDRFATPETWAFHEIPWRAALGIEPESEYVDRSNGDYAIARMIEDRAAPQDRIFSLTGFAQLYTTRQISAYWYSTQRMVLGEALQTALRPPPMSRVEVELPPQPLSGLRLVTNAASREEFRIFEIQLNGVSAAELQASPNLGEALLAIDANPATSWRSRGPAERGMFLALLFPPGSIGGRFTATLTAQSAALPLVLQVQRDSHAPWVTAADSLRTAALPVRDLRRDATAAVRRAGYRFLLARAGTAGMDLVSDDMVKHARDWGLRDRGEFTPVHLFEIDSIKLQE